MSGGWVQAGNAVRSNLRQTEATLNPVWARADSLWIATASVEQNLDTVSLRLERLLRSFQDSSGAMYGWLNDRKAYDDLEATVHFFQKILRSLQSDGLGKAIQYRRNVHLSLRKPH